MSKPGSPLYPQHRLWELEPHYSHHVSAMTTEQLHSKSDIAEQLAWRDQAIDALRARVEELDKLATERGAKLASDTHKIATSSWNIMDQRIRAAETLAEERRLRICALEADIAAGKTRMLKVCETIDEGQSLAECAALVELECDSEWEQRVAAEERIRTLEVENARLDAKWRDYETNYILPCFRWAKELGFDLEALVRSRPGHNCVELFVEALRSRIRTLEAELAEHEKWKPLVELARRLREFGSLQTDAHELYECIDTITGLRKFHADGTWHTGPACENCEKGPTDEG